MDHSNTEASASPSITEADIQEAMPPEYASYDLPPEWAPVAPGIEEVLPPERSAQGMDCNVTPPLKPWSRTVTMSHKIAKMMPPEHGTAARQDIVDQILAAADLKHVPANFDPDALYGDLRTSIWHYYAAVERQSEFEKHQIAELRKTLKMAKQLALRINSQEYIENSTREAVITVLEALINESKFKELMLDCRIMIDRVEEYSDPYYETMAGAPRGAFGAYTGWNPLTWLAGYFLPPVFEKHFGCEPTFYPDGQYARFAVEFLKAFGIKNKGKAKAKAKAYESGTIVRAMGDVRYNRLRQKTRA